MTKRNRKALYIGLQFIAFIFIGLAVWGIWLPNVQVIFVKIVESLKGILILLFLYFVGEGLYGEKK